MRTIVYGNGKSRQKWNVYQKLDNVVTWGCNRIFNDVKVDNLVSVDYWVQHLIYESGYAFNNKCWFADWTVLPPSFTGIPIYPVNPYPKNFKEVSRILQKNSVHYDELGKIIDKYVIINQKTKVTIDELKSYNTNWLRNYMK